MDHREGNKGSFNYPLSILLDSGASTHLVKNIPKHLNTSIQGIVKGSVKGGDSAKIIGSGNFKTGKIKFTAQIAPKLDANLLSAGKLIKEGYSITINQDITPGVDIEIKKENEIVATGHITENNMIELNLEIIELNEITRKTNMIDHIQNGHQGTV